MLLPGRPLLLCRRHGRTSAVLLGEGAARVEREAGRGTGWTEGSSGRGAALPMVSVDSSASGALWVECLQEMCQCVTQERGLPARGFLSSCLLGYWGFFGAFFFFSPSPCNFGFITDFSQNGTVGVRKTQISDDVFMVSYFWCLAQF